MTDSETTTVLAAIGGLREVVEEAAKAAMNAREIAADAVQVATDAALNIEAVRNDVAAHARLDSEQHAFVSEQISRLVTLQRDAASKSADDRHTIMAQLDELKPVKVFWNRALGTKEILVGAGGVLAALAAIGAAILAGIKLVSWLIGR